MRPCPHILERIVIFGGASNATASLADMIDVSPFISGHQAEG